MLSQNTEETEVRFNGRGGLLESLRVASPKRFVQREGRDDLSIGLLVYSSSKSRDPMIHLRLGF